jgi:hypothetical protein
MEVSGNIELFEFVAVFITVVISLVIVVVLGKLWSV